MSQIGIAIFGVLAIWLSQDERLSRRRWACVAGLCSQPFWFFTAYTAEQWGVLGLCFLYAASWAKGFYVHWIKAQP